MTELILLQMLQNLLLIVHLVVKLKHPVELLKLLVVQLKLHSVQYLHLVELLELFDLLQMQKLLIQLLIRLMIVLKLLKTVQS